jgi:asparagine synthase (glutamine-hydrolysing)
MCGIVGQFVRQPGQVDTAVLRRMIAMLGHRGPDGVGTYSDERVGLAHSRLSIIDLVGGTQPMHNEDASLWITFNGEIFNYLELREQLLAAGHQFSTRSDTEVILHLFEEKGEDCVRELNGQWAFALWDKKRRRLFLSRDRLGVRPLFYTSAGGGFLFASEVKALFAHPAVERELDLHGLDQIFTFWFTLPPQTAFKRVFELPPGHSMVVDDNGATIKRYWNLDYCITEPNGSARGEDECAEKLLDLLVDATRIRLRSDVPVGAYLSGGLDSTVTTALIRRFSDTPLKTFSIGFEEPEFDESEFQQQAIAYLHTEHQQARCSNADIGAVFPDVIWHTEKPVLRTAPAPLFLLSRLVHDSGFKVVLTGEGSDEILGGYDIFKEAKIRRFWGVDPDSKFRPLLLKRLYPYLPQVQAQSPAFLKAFFHLTPGNETGPFFSHEPRWDLTSRLKLFFSDEAKAELQCYDARAEIAGTLPACYAAWNWFCQAQYLESAYLLSGYILSSQGDRVGMAHSVEGRFPFLDYRVVEFAASLPPRLKMKVLNEKYLLKKCVRGLIPERVRQRHKQPYRAPDAKSFFHSAEPPYVAELTSPARIREDGIFSSTAVQKLVEKCRSGQASGARDNMALVGILSTQLVIDQFVRRFSSRAGS